MKYPSKDKVQLLRKAYPTGCRVVLDQMDDAQAPPIGTQGVCRGVDDTGSIMVAWDNGSSLNVVYGADCCHRVASEAEVKQSLEWWEASAHRGARCPRCGARATADNQLLAMSRRTQVSICDRCGGEEAIEDYLKAIKANPIMRLTQWAITAENWMEF